MTNDNELSFVKSDIFKNYLSGISEEMVTSIATSGKFSKEMAKAILESKGLKEEAIEAALGLGKFTDATGNSSTVLSKLIKNAKVFGKNFLKDLKELLIFLGTNPVGWIIDVVAAMGIAYAAYKKFNTSAKEAKENISNAFSESQDQLKTVKEQKENVDQLTESYDKLSKGVNTATNDNISLSTDSYKEYLDVCNQIAELYPDLVTGYDAQGNAILSLKGNVDALTDSYKKAQEEAYATAYYGVTDDKGKRTGGSKDRQKALGYATDTFDTDDNLFAKWGQYIVGNQDKIELTADEYEKTYKKMLKMSDEELEAFIRDTSADGSNYAGTFVDMIADGTHESFEKVRQQVQLDYNNLVSDRNEILSNEQTALEGYMKGITNASGTALSSGYDKLTEKQQNLATSLLSSLSFDDLMDFKNSGDFEKAEQDWVNNIVSSISNMSAEAKNAYDELQNSIANPDNLTTEGISNIDKYLGTLSDELGVTKDKLKEIFNLDDIFDTESSFKNTINNLLGNGSFDKLTKDAQSASKSMDSYSQSTKEAADKTKDLERASKEHTEAMAIANKSFAEKRKEQAKQEAAELAQQQRKERKQAQISADAHEEAIAKANARLKELNKEQVDDSTKSNKEVASNIQKAYDDADKSVSHSIDNIKNRNQGVADSIVNSDDVQHAKDYINDLADSVKEYDNAVSEAGKKSQYAGISDIDKEYKNSQDKINPWKQFGQNARSAWSSYIGLQQEAHKNNENISQAQADNVSKFGQKAKSVWDNYIGLQTEAYKNNVEVSQAQVDTVSKFGQKAKSVWDSYIGLQQKAHENDAAITQQQSDNISKVGEKIKSEANSWKDTIQNDFDGSYISGVKENFKKMGEAFNNNASVKYVKETGKDVINIIGTTAKLQDQVQQLSKVNESAGQTAIKGINNVINSTEILKTANEKTAQSSQEHDEAMQKANEHLKQKRKEQAKQAEDAIQAEKEQQAQTEKTERAEKRKVQQEETASKKREAAAKSESEAQKWIADNINVMTLSQKKMFIEASTGANSAAEALANYNNLIQDNALNTLSIDIDSVTEHITNLNTALSESASATGLTADSISNLKSMFSGLDDYDASALFMNTANGVKVNREELEKLNNEYAQQKTADAQEQLTLLSERYNDLTDQINTCSDASESANLYAQRNAVLDQIHDVQTMISQYDGLTSAYNEWVNAQNETSPGANYDSMYSYIETANEMAADGKWGNPAFKKYIEMMSGQDLSDAPINDIKTAWEGLAKTIGDTGYKLGDFLTEDGTGVDNFVDMLDKLDDKYVQLSEDGDYIINIDDMDALAERMGTDVSVVQALLDKMSEYGYTINVDSTDLELATTNAEEANKQLKDLFKNDENFQYTFNFSASGDDLTTEIQKAQELLDDPRFKNADGNFDINIEGASQAQQIMVALLAQKESLQEPTIMQIDTEQLSGTNKTVISTLQTIQSTIDGYEIQFGSKIDTTEMRQQIGDALDKIDDISPKVKEQLGLADKEVQSSISTLKKNIADGVELDSNSLSKIQKAFDNISPEVLASLGINMDEVQKDADAVAQSFETALTNVLSNLTITVDGKEIKFDIKEPDPIPVEVTADTSDVEGALKQVAEDGDVLSHTQYNTKLGANNSDVFSKIAAAGVALSAYANKTYTAYLAVKSSVQKVANAGISALQSVVAAQHANGTFHGYASGTNVSIQKNEDALVNELGTEGLLRNGVLHEIPGNAHIEHLKRGDIIFNHLQMEELSKYGYVQSNGGRGQLIGGYAYGSLNGLRSLNAYPVGTYTSTGKGKREESTINPLGDGGKSKDSKKSSSSKTKSSGSSGSSSSSSSSSSDTSSDAEKTEETLDWIETKISRIERIITNLGKTVSATYHSWSDRNNALSQELSDVNSEISIQQQAYNRYMQQANSVGLDAGYAQKVRDGKIDIETITDEDLKQKIEDYKNW